MLPSCATGAGQIFVYIFLTRVPRWTAPFSLSLNKYLSSFFQCTRCGETHAQVLASFICFYAKRFFFLS